MRRTIALTEFERRFFPPEAFTLAEAEEIWQRYRQQILVDPPSFKTRGQWQLTAQGWCGFAPLNSQLAFAIAPKVPLANLFQMLSVAYGLDEIAFDEGLIQSDSLDGFVDRLAWLLVSRVERLWHWGLVQEYAEQVDALPYVAGQIDFAALATFPASQQVVCRHEVLTQDVPANQVLLWTLHLILQSHGASATVEQAIRRMQRLLSSSISLHPHPPDVALHIKERSKRSGYAPLMALCHFFMTHCAPGDQSGHHDMVAFLIPTAQLFERYVAIWLRQNLPATYQLHIQERHALGTHEHLHFAIDLTIREQGSRAVRWVMDTKYKAPGSTPATADIAQVVAYAEATGATEAILIYPAPLPRPLDEQIGKIRLRSLVFDLGGELEDEGRKGLEGLGIREGLRGLGVNAATESSLIPLIPNP